MEEALEQHGVQYVPFTAGMSQSASENVICEPARSSRRTGVSCECSVSLVGSFSLLNDNVAMDGRVR